MHLFVSMISFIQIYSRNGHIYIRMIIHVTATRANTLYTFGLRYFDRRFYVEQNTLYQTYPKDTQETRMEESVTSMQIESLVNAL